MMTPELLRKELEAAGLFLLAVSAHHHDPTVAVIYLEGNQGQWANGFALNIVADVPGVRSVAENVRTPAIIMAWLDASDETSPEARPTFIPNTGDARTNTKRKGSI